MTKLEKKSIRFLQVVGHTMPDLFLGFSGGKDSVVIYDLAKRAGIKFTAVHSNTTIDPPGTIPFIRKHFPDVLIHNPGESFYQLLQRKPPPTRQTRYCCEKLKEQITIGRNNISGVRSSESVWRRDRDYIQCDTRKEQMGAKHIYPIYDWTDDDVWEYIHRRNLPIAPCYKEGFKRLGCVGCPLIYPKQRRWELAKYPRYYEAMKRSIAIGMKKNPQWKISVATDGDAEIAMQWWLSNKSINQYFTDHIIEKVDGVWVKRQK